MQRTHKISSQAKCVSERVAGSVLSSRSTGESVHVLTAGCCDGGPASLRLQRMSLRTFFFFQTPSAVNKIKQLLKDKPEHVGLKVGVRTRGCNGLSYSLEYTKTKGDSDEEVIQDGVRVFIEKKAQLTLLGTEMDYVEDKLSSEFVFNNPNIKGTCGCGESFNI